MKIYDRFCYFLVFSLIIDAPIGDEAYYVADKLSFFLAVSGTYCVHKSRWLQLGVH